MECHAFVLRTPGFVPAAVLGIKSSLQDPRHGGEELVATGGAPSSPNSRRGTLGGHDGHRDVSLRGTNSGDTTDTVRCHSGGGGSLGDTRRQRRSTAATARALPAPPSEGRMLKVAGNEDRRSEGHSSAAGPRNAAWAPQRFPGAGPD